MFISIRLPFRQHSAELSVTSFMLCTGTTGSVVLLSVSHFTGKLASTYLTLADGRPEPTPFVLVAAAVRETLELGGDRR